MLVSVFVIFGIALAVFAGMYFFESGTHRIGWVMLMLSGATIVSSLIYTNDVNDGRVSSETYELSDILDEGAIYNLEESRIHTDERMFVVVRDEETREHFAFFTLDQDIPNRFVMVNREEVEVTQWSESSVSTETDVHSCVTNQWTGQMDIVAVGRRPIE